MEVAAATGALDPAAPLLTTISLILINLLASSAFNFLICLNRFSSSRSLFASCSLFLSFCDIALASFAFFESASFRPLFSSVSNRTIIAFNRLPTASLILASSFADRASRCDASLCALRSTAAALTASFSFAFADAFAAAASLLSRSLISARSRAAASLFIAPTERYVTTGGFPVASAREYERSRSTPAG